MVIKYDLKCNSCKQVFEGWFSNIDDFDRQKDKNLLSCPTCGACDVKKALMAPNISTSEQRNSAQERAKQLRSYVEHNFEDVGNRFTDEAIAMYNGETESRNIHGTITKKDEERLNNERIPYIKLSEDKKLDS